MLQIIENKTKKKYFSLNQAAFVVVIVHPENMKIKNTNNRK
jgi:hypothetical protein